MKKPTEGEGVRGDFLSIHMFGLFYLGSKFQISFFVLFFRKNQKGDFLGGAGVGGGGIFFLEYASPNPPTPYAGDSHPLPLPPPVYQNFCDATQSALFRASAPCPFLILAGALGGGGVYI